MKHNCSIRPAWTPLTITLMVLGFVIFWPLGLAMLAYILWGDKMQDAFYDVRRQFHNHSASHSVGRSGNVAFDEYREKELKRLAEERRKLDTMREEFDTYMRNLRRAKDKEEFDRFMNARATTPPAPEAPDGAAEQPA